MQIICPECQSENVIKHGRRRDKQRYICNDCSKAFSEPLLEFSEKENEKSKVERSDSYINIVCSSRRIFTEQDLIDEYEIDTEIWSLEKFIVRTDEAWRKDREVEWDVTDGKTTHGRVRDSGKILLVPLTRIEARFVRKTMQDIDIQDIREILSTLPTKKPPRIKPTQYSLDGKLLEINYADPHHGRWYADADAEHLDSKIEKTIADIVAKAKGQKFKEIILCLVGDVYDIDNMNYSTTKGTPQRTIMTPNKLFRHGVEQTIWMIDQLRYIAPVTYVFVPGNHDAFLSFNLAIALEQRYYKSKDVKFIINDDSRYAWYSFGVNLIAWTHGDIPKSNLFSWLPIKARKEWGDSKFVEIHMGHVNNQKVLESHGQIIRWIPSIADASLWEDGQGYAGNRKASVSYIWDSANGLEQEWFHNV